VKIRHISIRARFLLGMGLMLLPLALLGTGSFYVVRMTSEALTHMVEETIEELPRITHLKSLMMMAQMPPNDFLISGNASEQNTFNYFVRQIDRALYDLDNAPFGSDREQTLATQVRDNWREAVAKAEQIFTHTDIHAPGIDALMHGFDATVGKGISLVSQLEREGYRELEMQLASAQRGRRNMLQLLAILGCSGMLIAAISGLLLTRSVLRPLQVLRQGAEKIGRGDLQQQIDLQRKDEFGQLAEAFNAMALNLDRSQATLREMAIRDGLTGLLNRREFHQRLDGEIERVLRRQTDLSLVMIDIDHFKAVNDTHGHLTGDEVLREVATTISSALRTMDILARYGGEEFIIITPEPQAGAEVMAERIRQAVAEKTFMSKTGCDLRVTVSLGVASLPDNAGTATALLSRADEALYEAKQRGRNRVCVAGGHPPIRLRGRARL